MERPSGTGAFDARFVEYRDLLAHAAVCELADGSDSAALVSLLCAAYFIDQSAGDALDRAARERFCLHGSRRFVLWHPAIEDPVGVAAISPVRHRECLSRRLRFGVEAVDGRISFPLERTWGLALAVDPRVRHQRLGAFLGNHALDAAREYGAERVCLAVSARDRTLVERMDRWGFYRVATSLDRDAIAHLFVKDIHFSF